MSLTATIHQFDVDLADHDRGVFDSLRLRVARHPSESEDFLLARVLAYALEFTEGIEFSKGGISSPDEPAIAVRDLTGAYQRWIEIGTPDPDRLHRAAKIAGIVVVYVHRDPEKWLARFADARVHRAHALEAWALDRAFMTQLAARLERRMEFALAVTDRELLVSIGSETLGGAVTRLQLPQGPRGAHS